LFFFETRGLLGLFSPVFRAPWENFKPWEKHFGEISGFGSVSGKFLNKKTFPNSTGGKNKQRARFGRGLFKNTRGRFLGPGWGPFKRLKEPFQRKLLKKDFRGKKPRGFCFLALSKNVAQFPASGAASPVGLGLGLCKETKKGSKFF